MWFSFSKWNWVKIKIVAFALLVVLQMMFMIVYAVYQLRRTNYDLKELQECCDRCKMTPEVKKCKKLQANYYGLSDTLRSGGQRQLQAQVQSLWKASGCQKVLDEWAKHDPGSQ